MKLSYEESVMDPVEIAAAIKILSGLILDVAKAVRDLRNGDPDSVDLDGLIKRIEELPDLPVETDD